MRARAAAGLGCSAASPWRAQPDARGGAAAYTTHSAGTRTAGPRLSHEGRGPFSFALGKAVGRMQGARSARAGARSARASGWAARSRPLAADCSRARLLLVPCCLLQRPASGLLLVLGLGLGHSLGLVAWPLLGPHASGWCSASTAPTRGARSVWSLGTRCLPQTKQ